LTVGDLQGDAAGSDRLPAEVIASSFGRLYVMGNLGDDTLSDIGREDQRVSNKSSGMTDNTVVVDEGNISQVLSNNGSNYKNVDELESIHPSSHGDVNYDSFCLNTKNMNNANITTTASSPLNGLHLNKPQSAITTSSHSEEDISRLRQGLLKDVRHLEWDEEEGCDDEFTDIEDDAYVGSLQYKRDIAYSVVKMISYNLGYLAYLVSHIAKCDRIFFTGKFVAAHPLTLHSLTYALDFCANNSYAGKSLRVQPYFSKNYDGYIGAIGSLLRK